MTPFTHDGQLYTVGFPGAEWTTNSRAAGTGTLSRGRRSQPVQIVELTPREARPVLRVFPVEVPVGVGFLKRSGMISTDSPDELEALAGHCPVFRLDPVATR